MRQRGNRPAVLFASVDFHQIALPPTMAGFSAVAIHQPGYAGYIWWLLQMQSIIAGHGPAGAKIADRLRQVGWPIP